jgi:hypothetical protein
MPCQKEVVAFDSVRDLIAFSEAQRVADRKRDRRLALLVSLLVIIAATLCFPGHRFFPNFGPSAGGII